MKKVVADRRASLDEDEEVLKPMRAIVRQEFEKRKTLTLQFFPEDGDAVADTPRLTVAVLSPSVEWDDPMAAADLVMGGDARDTVGKS